MKILFYLTPQKTLRWLLCLLGVLLIAALFSNYLKWGLKYETALGFIPLFDFDAEYNLPTFFSFLVLLFIGLLLGCLYRNEVGQGRRQAGWKLFSYVFYFLALDEMAGIHERIGAVAHHLSGHYAILSSSRFWIIPYGILLVVFLLLICRFFFSLPRRYQGRFLLAGIIYIAGAVGIELWGEFYMWQVDGVADIYYSLLSDLEESLELLGLILFAYYLLRYMEDTGMHSIEINPASGGITIIPGRE